MPSGKMVLVCGFEGFALQRLLHDEGIPEDSIITHRDDVPVVHYTDPQTGKTRRYYTDIYLPHQKRCIEVKSNFTYHLDPRLVKEKHRAIKALGFICHIWIFDSKGGLIRVID